MVTECSTQWFAQRSCCKQYKWKVWRGTFSINANSVNGNCPGSKELARSLLQQWLLLLFCIKAKIRMYYLSRGLLSWSGIVRTFCRVLTLKEATNYRVSSSCTAFLTSMAHNSEQRKSNAKDNDRASYQNQCWNPTRYSRASIWPLCQSLANSMNYPEMQVGCTLPGSAASGTKAQASERV